MSAFRVLFTPLVYILMICVGVIGIYSLFTGGQPDSLLRPFFPDPANDFYITLISSFLVFILGFFLFYSGDRKAFRQVVQLNAERVKSMRREGKTDAEIADAILEAMQSRSGYKHNLAKKKLIIYLSELE